MNPSRDQPIRWATVYKGPVGWHMAVLETARATGEQAKVVEVSAPLTRFEAADLLTTYVDEYIIGPAD